MAVLPTFDPTQAPDTQAKIGMQSANDVQTWMTQAAQRQQLQANTAETQQNTQEQAAKFAAILPTLQAKGQADVLAAQNDLAASTLTQQLRGQWQSLKPQVVQDLANIHDPANIPKEADGTPDWNAIYNQYEGLQAKYGQLALLPEGKQYYQMIEDGKKNAFELAARHSQAQITLNQLKLASEYKLNNTIAGQDNAATVAATNKPAIAATEANNTIRNQGFTDISSQRDALNQMGFAISNIGKDIGNEQASPIAAGASRFLGPSIVGKLPGGAPVQQVQQDIGDFANRIMSTVKNIRNVNEFRAVTASIPSADDQPAVQNEKLAKLQTINQVLGQRNDYKETALRADPSLTPDQADAQATVKYPFPASIIGPIVKDKPPASLSPADSQALEWAKENPKDPRSAAILQHISTLP